MCVFRSLGDILQSGFDVALLLFISLSLYMHQKARESYGCPEPQDPLYRRFWSLFPFNKGVSELF